MMCALEVSVEHLSRSDNGFQMREGDPSFLLKLGRRVKKGPMGLYLYPPVSAVTILYKHVDFGEYSPPETQDLSPA